MAATNRCLSTSAINAHIPSSIRWKPDIHRSCFGVSLVHILPTIPGCDLNSQPIVEFHSKDRLCFCKLHDSILHDANAAERLNGNGSKSSSFPRITSRLIVAVLPVAVRILTVTLPQLACVAPVNVATAMSCFGQDRQKLCAQDGL